MARIQFFSDIHLEFAPLELPGTDADVIVAAGDIGLGMDGLEWLEQAGKPVVYVAGNHEYYCGDLPDVRNRLAATANGGNIAFLDGHVAVVGGVRFVGATLWTDFKGGNTRLMAAARLSMNDYTQIRCGESLLDPAYTVRVNADTRRWLEQTLRETHDGPTVIVTHHAPTVKSWKGAALSPYRYAYCNDLEYLLERHTIALWIHGHVHHVSDYTVHGVRVVCNPRGYTGFQTVRGFDPARTIEV